MSVAYKRLVENIVPIDGAQGSALPSDTRLLKTWLENLPRANPKETATTLLHALALAMPLRQNGNMRFNQLETIRATLLDSIEWLERQYVGSPLPMSAERLAFAQLAQALHTHFAQSMRLAAYEICMPEGKIPLLKSKTVASCLQFSVLHFQLSILQAWRIYRAPSYGVWQGLHRVFHFAKALSLHDKIGFDEILKRNMHIDKMYYETVMMSIMNPFGCASTDWVALQKIAAGFATTCKIQPKQISNHTAALSLDEDIAPDIRLTGNDFAYLDFSECYSALQECLAQAEGTTCQLKISKNESIEVALHFVQKITTVLNIESVRNQIRFHTSFQIETVMGLSAMHFMVCGGVDFDEFMQQVSQENYSGISQSPNWSAIRSHATQVRTIMANVLDHSLQGYHLQWSGNQSIRLRVGEMLCLNSAEQDIEPDWMVAAVRWIRYEDTGSVTAGLELLARRCVAVAIRKHSDGMFGQSIRALELMPLDESGSRQYLHSGNLTKDSITLDVLYAYDPYRIQELRHDDIVKTQVCTKSSYLDYQLLIEQ